MKKIVTSFILNIGILSFFSAQSNIVVSGSNATGNGGSFSASVGQIDYISATGSGGSLNQGNQQAFEIFENSIEENNLINVSIFPNPTNEYVVLKFNESTILNLFYQLIDINGKEIYLSNVQLTEQKIDFQFLGKGQYVLNILHENQSIKSYKIIKN
jgi:hypothetical protein